MKKESLREKFQLRLLLTFTQPANHCACWIFKFGKLEKSFPTRAPAAQMFDASDHPTSTLVKAQRDLYNCFSRHAVSMNMYETKSATKEMHRWLIVSRWLSLIYPNLLHLWTWALLHPLTSTFAVIIITPAARGCCLMININIGNNNLLAQRKTISTDKNTNRKLWKNLRLASNLTESQVS